MNAHKTNSLLAGTLLAGCLIFLFLRYGLRISIPCPFKALTGIPCPGCGGIRTLDALIHGDILSAFCINPLSFLLILAIGGSFVWLMLDLVRSSDSFLRFTRQLNDPRSLILLVALLLLAWVRNIVSGL